MKFNEWLFIERKRKKFTQYELSKKIGVSHPTIVTWESGRSKPSFEFILPLSQALNVNVYNILELE